jgi:hypothetical protein
MGKDADRDREDRQTFNRLNILFKGQASGFPPYHLKTFQKIKVLGSIQYKDYCTDENEPTLWKSETKARAQRLVDTVSRLTRNQSSEMQWRLDIEKIVYKRFELEIKWYSIVSYYMPRRTKCLQSLLQEPTVAIGNRSRTRSSERDYQIPSKES